MILITDSGSTQTTWIALDKRQTTRLQRAGINAMLFTPAQIRTALEELPLDIAPEAIFYYGAGCGSSFPEASAKLRHELALRFPTAQRIEIESDLVAAARALFGNGKGIACILGTGANSGLCDQGAITAQVPPLGYILGDEGSGAVLGRNLLNGIFKGHIPLRTEFLESIGMGYEQIIHRVYREPAANRFLASFAPFIAAHAACPEVHRMLLESFGEFVRRNLSHYPAELPVGFVGSIATHFSEPLTEALEAAGYHLETIVQSPAEGLINYHHGA